VAATQVPQPGADTATFAFLGRPRSSCKRPLRQAIGRRQNPAQALAALSRSDTLRAARPSPPWRAQTPLRTSCCPAPFCGRGRSGMPAGPPLRRAARAARRP
jgi:hypothetical protein